MAHEFVDGSGKLAAFHVPDEDVVQRPDDRPGECFDPVTVYDDHVGFPFAHDRPETVDGAGEDRIHRCFVGVVAERAYVGEAGTRDLDLRTSVAIDEVHSRRDDEMLEVVGSCDGPQQRFEFAEFRPRCGEKKEALHSPTCSRRNCVLRAMRLVARLPSTMGKSTARSSPVPGRFTQTFE